jgi:hypothetical protein
MDRDVPTNAEEIVELALLVVGASEAVARRSTSSSSLHRFSLSVPLAQDARNE